VSDVIARSRMEDVKLLVELLLHAIVYKCHSVSMDLGKSVYLKKNSKNWEMITGIRQFCFEH
jgi:hypothetical protein